MILHYKLIGSGFPVIILHGLFGSGDNWTSFAKMLSESHYAVYLTDLRNHGRSPHDNDHSYAAMSSDVLETMQSAGIKDPVIIGHSMGGKTAMRLALDNPLSLSALICVDIAPRYYAPHHQDIIKGLKNVNAATVKSRSEAEDRLSEYVDEPATRQFLMKNLYWKTSETLDWRFNLKALSDKAENTGEKIEGDPVEVPALFVKGSRSEYIKDRDMGDIKNLFPQSEIITIENAGHWIHADQPQALLESVTDFLKKHHLIST